MAAGPRILLGRILACRSMADNTTSTAREAAAITAYGENPSRMTAAIVTTPATIRTAGDTRHVRGSASPGSTTILRLLERQLHSHADVAPLGFARRKLEYPAGTPPARHAPRRE